MNERPGRKTGPNSAQKTALCRMLPRRAVVGSLFASPFFALSAGAKEIVDLKWQDLLPEGEVFIPDVLSGFVDHSDLPLYSQQPESTGTRSEWNGQTVRIPGFIVPIDFDGTGITAFILVPFVGACVHVPPPPANQLIFVTTTEPYQSDGLFEAVTVTGLFGVSSLTTQLAEVGYALSANKIEPVKL